MGKINYIDKNFRPASLALIETANQIIDEYDLQGFSLTLRQLYYQFVARDIIPNTMKSYKNLGSVINDGRLAGLIDWNAIEDRTRNLKRNAHWDNASDAVYTIEHQFSFDKWSNQEYRPEIWIEKEALVGIVENVCREYDVPYFACRGYVSQSEQWRAGRRFLNHISDGQLPIVIHLGDHDPSGIDMTRDNGSRLSIFAEYPIEIQRIALNMDQIEQYEPPPNPAKLSDSRAKDYISKFGYDSWELDALEPRVIVDLIETTINTLRDVDKWDEMIVRENETKEEFSRYRKELERKE